MTPDERQMISGLFDRMRDNRPADKDRDAERFISDAMRQTPDAAYLLVQSVLAQEHYLQQAGSRIEELEGRMRDLEDDLARLQQGQSRSGGGSFLGGLFGGGRQADSPPAARSSGSVPSFGAGRGGASNPAYGSDSGSPWGRQQPQQAGYAAAPGSTIGQQPMAQQPARGGGFMASALTTAAGVAGGMLAANAISNMFGGGSGAHASTGNQSTSSTQSASSEPSPYEVNSNSDAQREADWAQDAQQDAEIEQASYDDSSDWGSADDSDI